VVLGTFRVLVPAIKFFFRQILKKFEIFWYKSYKSTEKRVRGDVYVVRISSTLYNASKYPILGGERQRTAAFVFFFLKNLKNFKFYDILYIENEGEIPPLKKILKNFFRKLTL
jgi:hypothetical protein